MWEGCGKDQGAEGKGRMWGRMEGLRRLKKKKGDVKGGLEGCV